MTEKLPTWKVRSRDSDFEWEGALEAYWEVSSDPISDNYSPDEISAHDLFDIWARKVSGEFSNGLVPVHWFVQCISQGKFSSMPFQFEHYPEFSSLENFLTLYTWPVHPVTATRLDWLALPIVDKSWNAKRADKGGFIQEATGWKPSPLQPYVYLPALICSQESSAVPNHRC